MKEGVEENLTSAQWKEKDEGGGGGPLADKCWQGKGED